MGSEKKQLVVSACIDVCTYKQGGRCTGCTMTRRQKAKFKKMKSGASKQAFLHGLVAQLQDYGKYESWARAYRKKCKKKGAACFLDKLEKAAAA
jgi:hypothetical protein